VVDRIASMAADVMGLRNGARPDWRDRFFDHGFDSLMALDLRNRMASEFGIDGLRSTVVFDYPSPLTLAKHLCESMSLLALKTVTGVEPVRAAEAHDVAEAQDIEDRLGAALADWQRERDGQKVV
jgi:Phosphopantetheine attachment site